ncbi:MAG: class I SAM-dependent methyltransferase [Burkholderiales bacterium]
MSSPADFPLPAKAATRNPHALSLPSPWIVRWSHLVRQHGTVLDVACGQGRHMQWFAQHNHSVTGVDRAPHAIAFAEEYGRTVCADIENGPWPFAHEQFDAVVVANYLWRPLLPTLLHSLAPGGVLIYETFAQGNETVGKPSRPDFLLRPGELLTVCAGLHVVGYEQGFLDSPARFVQRIAAVKPPELPEGAAPVRYML